MTSASFPALLQSFFTERLIRQRCASPNTIASYRDTFRLMLRFGVKRLSKAPSTLLLEELDTSFVGAFLDHLETDRGNSARTRNTRLAAIHSFFEFVALTEPANAHLCQRVLAIPSKRYVRRPIEFLHRDELDALIAAPNLSTWIGRRDQTLLAVASQTGLRVSELTGLCCRNVVLGIGAHVRCEGKGRKQRCTPLRKEVVALLGSWLREREGTPDEPVFPGIRGGSLSRDAVERLVARHTKTAQRSCLSLSRKRVTPHVLRHTAAMELLQHGVDRTVIALWLGHESVETTQIYLHADMRLKEQAMARTTPGETKPGRYRPGDELLKFLEGL